MIQQYKSVVQYLVAFGKSESEFCNLSLALECPKMLLDALKLKPFFKKV